MAAELTALKEAASIGRVETSAWPRVLVLDDDHFMLSMMSTALRKLGCPQVRSAGSAEGALQLLARDASAFDVIVCDLNMPGTDGIAFLQQLRNSAYEGSIVLLSGESPRLMYSVQRLLSESRLTVLGGLSKPVSPAAMRSVLAGWTSAHQRRGKTAPAPVSSQELQAPGCERQWVLHYQPIVDLPTGRVTAMEALVRWQHPTHGLLFPDSFICVAEACGAIHHLTDWVLREAVDQLGRWRQAGWPLKMAVNLSMKNLWAPDFQRRISNIVAHSVVSPQDLVLEVTESRVGGEHAVPLEQLLRLRMQRFELAIDDFGTGHSSLVQLRDIPFTRLKVDRGFVHGASHNEIIRPMLEASISLAHRLGMQVVAEGVETEQDLALLRALGCDTAQGYLFSRPMTAADAPAWVQQRHPPQTDWGSM